jgi:rRNA biogenesis protein RRP5
LGSQLLNQFFTSVAVGCLQTLSVGMKMWGAVLEVTAHDLVISLPHGLRGFVTPKESSDLVAELLEAAGDVSDSDSDSDNEDAKVKGKIQAKKGVRAKDLPALTDLFTIGQRVQCMISSVTGAKKSKGEGKGEGTANKRIDLTLRLSKLHKSLDMASLREGLNLSAYVRSVEDHGYIVSFGIPGTTGNNRFIYTCCFFGILLLSLRDVNVEAE